MRVYTNIKYLLKYNNNIWNEWAFKRYVESEDYKGPDMTDFGRRALKDEAFNEVYKEEMEKYKKRILTDDTFAKKYGELGNRSEEHTSELQSRFDLVCRLLLEK